MFSRTELSSFPCGRNARKYAAAEKRLRICQNRLYGKRNHSAAYWTSAITDNRKLTEQT
jgi:hypothetical protein